MRRVLGVVCVMLLGSASNASSAPRGELPWIVDAASAKRALDQGATLLDARTRRAYIVEHARGAVHVTWQEFSRGKGAEHGRLRSTRSIQKRLRAKGVSSQGPVLVVGDPKAGWGEEGRVVWMLRLLGHRRAAVVDGGWSALRATGVKVAHGWPQAPRAGDFRAKRTRGLEIKKEALLQRRSSLVILDTRERREYEGATPYGESRGGHIPGAQHLYFKELLAPNGKLLPKARLRAKLKEKGVVPGKKVVAYCTGGIRSAWVVAVLAHLGYGEVANYTGSMWEWSAAPASEYPLEGK